MPNLFSFTKIPLGRIQLTEVEFSFIQVMTQRSNNNVGYCYTLVLYLLEEDKLLLFNLIKSCVPSTGKSSYSHPIAGKVSKMASARLQGLQPCESTNNVVIASLNNL